MFDVIYKRVSDVWRRKYVDSRPEDVSVPETAADKDTRHVPVPMQLISNVFLFYRHYQKYTQEQYNQNITTHVSEMF